MLDPAVTLTDYGLALECAVFAGVCVRRAGGLAAADAWFFATLAVAALVGGTSHGFFADESTAAYRALWVTTLLAIGGTAFAMWLIAARLCLAPRVQRAATIAALLATTAYAAVVIGGRREFLVAIVFYVPPALAMLVAFVVALRRSGERRWWAGIAGVLGTFAAAAIQACRVPLGPLGHNASYHLVQAVALVGIVACAPRAAPASAQPSR
jgi:hypothetical protein